MVRMQSGCTWSMARRPLRSTWSARDGFALSATPRGADHNDF
jgi:hypothetical protein